LVHYRARKQSDDRWDCRLLTRAVLQFDVRNRRSNYGAQMMLSLAPKRLNYFVYVGIADKSLGFCKVKVLPHWSNS
jgi:hypothetical protein